MLHCIKILYFCCTSAQVPNEQDVRSHDDRKPMFKIYETDKKRHNLADWLLTGNWQGKVTFPKPERHYEYEGYDGFYNNIAVNDLGAVGNYTCLTVFTFVFFYSFFLTRKVLATEFSEVEKTGLSLNDITYYINIYALKIIQNLRNTLLLWVFSHCICLHL